MRKTEPSLAVAAGSHVGRVRSVNQDACGYSAEARCFVVCDGVGGAAGGETASQVTVQTVLERLVHRSSGGVPRRMEQAVCAANRLVYARGQREPALHGMGTTLVLLVFEEEACEKLEEEGMDHEALDKKTSDKEPPDAEPSDPAHAWLAHVGDSRCYLLRDRTLVRCTHDHSLVEEQVRLGKLTVEEAATSPMRHVITRAVGVQKAVAVDVRQLAVEPGDCFLLCSDGLTRELDDSRIAELLTKTANAMPQELVDTLVAEALAAGGGDNITCLLVQVAPL